MASKAPTEYTLDYYRRLGFVENTYCYHCKDDGYITWDLCTNNLDKLFELSGYVKHEYPKPMYSYDVTITTTYGQKLTKKVELRESEILHEKHRYLTKIIGGNMEPICEHVYHWFKSIKKDETDTSPIALHGIGEYSNIDRKQYCRLPYHNRYTCDIPDPAVLIGLLYLYPRFAVGILGCRHKFGN